MGVSGTYQRSRAGALNQDSLIDRVPVCKILCVCACVCVFLKEEQNG